MRQPDGGVRLNAPFDAALAMGTDRVVVISGHSVGTTPTPPQPRRVGLPDRQPVEPGT